MYSDKLMDGLKEKRDKRLLHVGCTIEKVTRKVIELTSKFFAGLVWKKYQKIIFKKLRKHWIVWSVNYYFCAFISIIIILGAIFHFQEEDIRPVKLAIDRPSEKFLAFLDKYYGLSKIIPQNNKFVVFQGFFDDGMYFFFSFL